MNGKSYVVGLKRLAKEERGVISDSMSLLNGGIL